MICNSFHRQGIAFIPFLLRRKECDGQALLDAFPSCTHRPSFPLVPKIAFTTNHFTSLSRRNSHVGIFSSSGVPLSPSNPHTHKHTQTHTDGERDGRRSSESQNERDGQTGGVFVWVCVCLCGCVWVCLVVCVCVWVCHVGLLSQAPLGLADVNRRNSKGKKRSRFDTDTWVEGGKPHVVREASERERRRWPWR